MIEVKNLTVAFGEKTVLRGMDFALSPGARAALLGPSGCGKTTFLRVLAGLQRPDAGAVRVDARRVACVFQEPRLLPWRTAAQNVNLVLSDRAETLAAAEAWLARLGLAQAAGQLPAALSGGMQQRVSLARALAANAPLLLLDESFRALDDALRQTVLGVVNETAAALVLVTHDAAEAAALGCALWRYRDGAFYPEQ